MGNCWKPPVGWWAKPSSSRRRSDLTDSSLLGDGVRVLTRVMKKVSAVAGLWETAGNHQSGGGPSQAVLAGDRAEGQARRPRDIAQSQKATGRNDSTRAAGHAPGTPARH